MTDRRPLVMTLVLALLAMLTGAYVAYLPAAPAPDDTVADSLYTAAEVVGAGTCVARAVMVRRDRTGWALMAGYLVLWTAGDLGWTLHFDAVGDPPYPNWTDAAYLASYSLAYAGQGLLVRSHVHRLWRSLLLDGLVTGLTLGSVCAAVFFGEIVSATAGRPAVVAVTLAYPVLDVVLLCVVGVAFGVSGWRPGRSWWVLGTAIACNAIGDAIYCYQEAAGTYTAASLVNVTWPLSMMGVAMAAWPPAPRGAARAVGETSVLIPAVSTLVSLGILVWAQGHHVPMFADALAAAALLVVAIRALLTHRENAALLALSREEALTDGLTGLGNRRRLMADVDVALTEVTALRPATLMFFDLDGFKAYNDAFGHSAGDTLLAQLGGRLTDAVDGVGAAYRLGGDEFCVVARGAHDATGALQARAQQALAERGEGFEISASCGTVLLTRDARTANLALQVADERMYADKDSRRGSAKRQARDLLLQILHERDPHLGDHTTDVAVLARAVGRELGLAGEALDELTRGAELHDVGKIAVPESILDKPGPLDDEEWALMCQHTIIGERILAAAPALEGAAPLVRSSHERFDGDGYPDGLAGADIPLGARIITACDAYDAMRQQRPYAPAMSERAALDELRRCAGAHFDPQVVEALIAVLAAAGPAVILRVA